MTEFSDVVRQRRMTRSFAATAVPRQQIADLIDLAVRAPSAGKSQGWNFVALDGEHVAEFWDITLPIERRSKFAFPHLLTAPVIVLPCADPQAYVERYAAADKAHTDLGSGPDAWPTPYWTIDTAMATMTLLLAAQDAGLGALFFAVFKSEAEIRQRFNIPAGWQLLGAVALGHPLPATDRPGVSAQRPRRTGLRWVS